MSLCQTVGGEMAVAEREEAYQAMVGAVQGVTQQCGTSFYSGYTDREEEGEWLGAGGQQHWGVWGEGQPNRDGTPSYRTRLTAVIIAKGEANGEFH